MSFHETRHDDVSFKARVDMLYAPTGTLFDCPDGKNATIAYCDGTSRWARGVQGVHGSRRV